MRILVAEDEAPVRRLLGQTLVRLGHEAVTVESGRAALEAFEREYFPVLISDWRMPEVNGLELCRRVRAQKRAKYTYIILLTAFGGKGHFLEGMKAGADDFITKPFDPEELQARLRVAERILGLQAEVSQLQSLLPICSYCKKIRDEHDVWTPIEEYIAKRTDTVFSHGLCQECYEAFARPQIERLTRGGAWPPA